MYSPYSTSMYGNSMYGGGAYSQYNQMRPPLRPGQQPVENQQPNGRKVLFEEYFKMMGGLRSTLQMGFALVALINFGSKSCFLINTSKKFSMFIYNHIPFGDKIASFYHKLCMLSPNSQNSHTVINKLLFALRIISIILLLIGWKLKNNLQQEVDQQHKIILNQYTQLEKKMENVQDEIMHQKQGYF